MPGGGYQGHRSDEWTDFELQTLYDHATDAGYLRKVCALLPRRTANAIMQRMCALRKEAGITVKGAPMGRPPTARLDAENVELLRKMEKELASARLADCRRLRHEDRATAACNDRRPDTSE